VLVLGAEGRAPVRYPVRLRRDERLKLDVELPSAQVAPPGFVYVPAGRFLFGSGDEGLRRGFLSTVPMHEVYTAAFWIAKDETTYSDWLAYLAALGPEERAKRTPNVGKFSGALELKSIGPDRWEIRLKPGKEQLVARTGEKISYAARKTRAVQDWMRFPVSGVTFNDAEAYAAWLQSSGKVPGARVCEETEWERAARGADAREYPHGDALEPDDANFDETYGRDPLSFGPDEVGSHPASTSPFGVDDLAGNVWEWVRATKGEPVARGGAYYYDRNTSRSTNRQVPEPTLRDVTVGVRICATPH
jgi:formylglycine-generating enzyme required for sulfatase activity